MLYGKLLVPFIDSMHKFTVEVRHQADIQDPSEVSSNPECRDPSETAQHASWKDAYRQSAVPGNVFEAILQHGNDFDYKPAQNINDHDLTSTDCLPGTHSKIEVIRKRVEAGHPLWHPEDRKSYDDACKD